MLNGWKSYTGAALFGAFEALAAQVPAYAGLFHALAALAAGLFGVGIAHKIDKAKVRAAALLLCLGLLAGCTTGKAQTEQTAGVESVAETGQGGTDAAAAMLFANATTRPGAIQTPVTTFTFPNQGSEITRPVTTLRRTYDPATGKLVAESYDTHLDPDGKPLLETVSGGIFLDARGSTFTNSVTPQGSVDGSSTSQGGTASPTAAVRQEQTTSVPVTADIAVTLPNGKVIPAGGVIPAGTPASAIPAGATLTPVE